MEAPKSIAWDIVILNFVVIFMVVGIWEVGIIPFLPVIPAPPINLQTTGVVVI